MNTHAEKTQENKSQSVSSGESQMQSDGESTFQFVDNRPEAIAQRKRQEMVNNSPRTMQLRPFQDMTNRSHQSKEAAQLQAMVDNYSAREQQPIQKNENNTGLPDNLKSGIENLSGYSMDDVKVHRNSSKPAQLQAHAYAQGTEIHLGSGQEKHLPHEAWHVVQQKQGRVKPTMQMKGELNINDDAVLEKEADEMGQKSLNQSSQVSNSVIIDSITTNNTVQRAIGIEFETEIPVYELDTEEKAARSWKRYTKKVDKKNRLEQEIELKEAGLAPVEDVQILKEELESLEPEILKKYASVQMIPSSVDYDRKIKDVPGDQYRLGVDHCSGIKSKDDNDFPPLLLGRSAILELITYPIESREQFVRTIAAMKILMTSITGKWGTDTNKHIPGYLFGPADQDSYPDYDGLQGRRDAVNISLDGKVQVSFGIDPRRIYDAFSEIADADLETSPLPVNKREIKRDGKRNGKDDWQADLTRATQVANIRATEIYAADNTIGNCDGLKSVFTYWAYYLLRGNRPLDVGGSEKNIPKFLMKASYFDLYNQGLTHKEREYIDDGTNEKDELDKINVATGVNKSRSDYLFNATKKGERASNVKVKALLGGDEIIAPTEYISSVGVRATTSGERRLMLDDATTDDYKKTEAVFESRSVGQKNIDDLNDIYDYYQDWLGKHNAKKWTD